MSWTPTLVNVHGMFRRWLGAEYDLDAINAVLAVAAVERIDGEPVWLLLISGSGNAKTETVLKTGGDVCKRGSARPLTFSRTRANPD
jgi:hypothetical protein